MMRIVDCPTCEGSRILYPGTSHAVTCYGCDGEGKVMKRIFPSGKFVYFKKSKVWSKIEDFKVNQQERNKQMEKIMKNPEKSMENFMEFMNLTLGSIFSGAVVNNENLKRYDPDASDKDEIEGSTSTDLPEET